MAGPRLLAQRYNFKFYGDEEGLQNLVVQKILQDRAGFLWAGTQNGLFRYDGNRFTGFTKADGLPGARIESLHESVDGTLWVGTRTGIARRAGDKFETIPVGVARGVVGREGLASDRSGHLYIATERGLAVGTEAGGTANPQRWSFRLIAAPPGHPADEEAASVFADSSGTVWFGCGLRDLCRLEDGKATEIGAGEGLPQDHWEAIIEDPEGNIWVRSERLLAVRAPGAHHFQLHSVPPATNTYPTLALDPRGHILVPTKQGLARQSGPGWEIVGAEQGLNTNDISAVEQDREGSIWLGFLGSGLGRWLGYNEWQSWNEHEGISRESVWSVLRDPAGTLWVGTQFGLNYADERGGRLVWRRQSVPGLEMTRALASAPDGTLWIAGGYRGGLRQWNPRTGSSHLFGPADGLKNDSVLHVAVDSSGAIWVSTMRGLFRGIAPSGSSPRFEQVQPAGTQPGEAFSMVLADRQGRIWVGGDQGLARLSGGQWTRFTTSDGLKDSGVSQIAEDPDGSLWIGYREANGLTRLRFPDGTANAVQLEHFTISNGLWSDKTVFLGFDARRRLWVGTDRGTDVFDHTGWRHYGHADGLIWDDCNGNAFFAESAGGIWIGTSRGLSRFQPNSGPVSGVPPPVVFTSVKLGGKEADPTATLDIPYRQNTLQVRFAALTFTQESNVLFRYRMANRERNWMETRQRELNYPTLAPGPYTLEVIARNAQGTWSAEPARLSFQILTPWWLTWWARIASVLVALLLGHLMWRRRTHRLEAERQRLENAVGQRTSELLLEKQRVIEEKSRTEQENAVVQRQKQEIERLLDSSRQSSRYKSEFLANVSHEIRTPMNGILGMTDMVLATELTPEQREYLETARLSADSLLTLLNDVLDFSKIEAGKMDLNPTRFSLRLTLHQIVKIFSLAAAEKRLHLGIEIGSQLPDTLIGDPDRLQQILINLIGNAIKFTSEGGVQLSVRQEHCEGDALMARFEVRDTGIGIPADKQQLIFEAFRQADGSTTRRFGGTGLGLAICCKLVELMGGQIGVESEPGRGSVFYFTCRFAIAATEETQESDSTASVRNAPRATGTNIRESAPAGLRILLAEDNLVNQQLERKLLERRGHKVTIAASGREALDCLDEGVFDVILMDVQMPDMDGLEATEAIRARERVTGAHIPIVALTARTMSGDRERCLEAGMDAYITKPIKAAEFLEAVETVAAGAGQRAATSS